MLDHVRATRAPRWIGLTVFVVVLVVVFVLLGRWQLHRAHAQNEADQAKAAAQAAAAVGPDALLVPGATLPAADEWRAVTATGTYDAAHQLLVRNRPFNSTNGYLVLVPLRTAGGDLLVVRGWIPAGSTADAPDALPEVPSGTVTVTGRMRAPEPATSRTGLPDGQVERIVPAEVAQLTGRPTYGGWLSLQSETPAPPTAAQVQTLPADGSGGWTWPISHTVYAMQWFTFGVIAVVGWFVLLRRDVRDPVTDRTTAEQKTTQEA